ncbi:winged helix-turn-helix domain-containing protein [Nonomuraea sp. NPDC050663]|uniref:winged helix-turn-helix domain-containing protein n=1 Tax=Nonomuraea sp. NPDC050663 TaxID=3364370 RepID=UPI00378F8E72
MAGESEVPAWDPDAPRIGYDYEAVADHIEARIRAGQLKPNMPLPGERALSEEYGHALGTIRRATELLRERGLVRTLPGKGSFVVPQEPANG